jgi:hypothetical protein
LGKWKKLANIVIIASMASKSHVLGLTVVCTDKLEVLSPLASGMFASWIIQIDGSLNASEIEVTGYQGCQTSFGVMLGFGPLILAPFSETFEGSHYS